MGDAEDDSYLIVVVGNSGVGKTTLILKYCNDVYNPDPNARQQTINVDFKTVEKQFEGKKYKLQIVCTLTSN
jgi:GTPase SAR1 family protein